MNGTVKVGRWEYPATQHPSGAVKRNTKRDGSGEWVDADAAKFVAEPSAPAVPEVAGFTADGDSDHDDLRVAYLHVFDSHYVSTEDIAKELGTTPARTKAILDTLERLDLTTSSGAGIKPVLDPTQFTRADAAQRFMADVPLETKVRAGGHGGKVGAQSAKPGKSTWQPGDDCPKGLHRLTDEDGDNPVYVMPSGRKQCRMCRRGYASNTGGAS